MVLSLRKTRLSSGVARVNGGGDGGRGRVGGVHVHVRINTISFIRDSVKICLDVSQKNYKICMDCPLTFH